MEFFLSPSSCTNCYGNQVDACDQGFVSTTLWLKFRSDGYPSCVWGLCSSCEDAKVRLGWLVVVHDVPGPLAVFRERRVGKSQWRAVHVRHDQTLVFFRDSTGAVISTSRGIYHLRCPYISFSSGSRSAERFEILTLVQKLVHARSWRTSLVVARSWNFNMHRASNSNQDIVHLSSQEKSERVCDLKVKPRSSQWAGRLTTVRTTPNRRVGGLDDCVHARKSASERVWNLIYRSREARFSEQICGGL